MLICSRFELKLCTPLSAWLILDLQMASVAERFGMSVQRLIDLNADLANITDANFIKDGEERVISHHCYQAPLTLPSSREQSTNLI